MLLERDSELAAVRDALAEAARGRGCVLVVQGPPGAGKTELLAATVSCAAASGSAVLTARGRELERQIALGVAVDLLGPALAGLGPAKRDAAFSGWAAPCAALFGPSPVAPDSRPQPAPDTLLAGLCQLIESLASIAAPDAGDSEQGTGGLLLAIDDLQWADAASRRFLAMLAARVADQPLVLAAAVRDGDPDDHHAAAQLLAEHRHGRILRPAPLSVAAVGRLVAQVFPSAGLEVAASVARVSGGNPFLVGELLHSLRCDGVVPAASAVDGLVPQTVIRSVLARLGRLPEDAGTLAVSLAVLGDGTPLPRAAAHAHLPLAAAERAADALTAARLVQPGNPLTYAHPLIGAAVLADMPTFARSRAHRRAADLLLAAGEPPERAAGHLLATEPEGSAHVVEVLAAAGLRASERGDPAAAARLLRRALAEPPPAALRGELLLQTARAQRAAGDLAAAATLTESLTLIEAPSDRARALTLLARVRQGENDNSAAAAAWEAALDCLEPHDPCRHNILAEYLTTATFHPPLRRRAEKHLAHVLAAAQHGTPPAQPGLAAHAALACALRGEPPERVMQLAAAATAADPLLGEAGGNGVLAGLVVHALVIAGEFEAAERIADAAFDAAGRRGDVIAYGYAGYHRALARLNRGRLAAALADVAAAQAPHAAGWSRGSGWNAWLLARIHLARGDVAAAARAAQPAVEPAPTSMEKPLLCLVRAQLDLAEGRPAQAQQAAHSAARLLRKHYGVDHPGLLPWRTTAALAALQLGDRRHAAALAEQSLDRAREVHVAAAIGSALRLSGRVATGERAVALLTEAVDVLQRTAAGLEHASALADLAAAQRRCGQTQAATGTLRRAYAQAETMQAGALIERTRVEIRALGLRPRRAATSGIDALTAAEWRAAELARSGQTNRAIAQTLFVSVKTVETHLANAYRKLGIAGRAALDAALGPPLDTSDTSPTLAT
ncbi:helix-turn-helix transcriptional regulator [Rugosimonospora africana]|uniref:HTH luxR-type domain-containing protein n=1 Tax=Rugosimonospora africana TaxID=556532 RepID=A0A8J3VWL7_9ACTN|nr:LuxR family transcriptional regulator [Rugosimonospora africana]GIH21445.1 hypothetical protein Raf01_96170 [Rugosimonospora africana]